MIRTSSLERLFSRFFTHHTSYTEAVRIMNVPMANRHIRRVSEILGKIKETESGREALERMLSDADPYLRLRAAGSLIRWMPHKAIPVLGKLTFEPLEGKSVDERIDIRTEAKGWLFTQFGVKNFDRNELIVPLRKYGVEMPYRDNTRWE